MIFNKTLTAPFNLHFKTSHKLNDKSNINDEELAIKSASGSIKHFEVLLLRYSAAIYRLAYRFVGNSHDAEDIAQDTFIKVFRALPKTNLDMPFKPWLYRIAINTAISYLRKKKKEQLNKDLEIETHDFAESLLDKDEIQFLINKLPLDYRKVIVLKAIDDLSYREISLILNIPETTARTWFYRAKNLIHNLMR